MASRSPALALQRAIYAALTTSPDMIAAYGGAPRVFDTVPAGANGEGPFPYNTIGEDQIVGDAPQLVDEAFAKIETWSRSTDWIEAKTIEDAVRIALSMPLELQGHNTLTWKFHGSIPRKEPDGITRRIITTFIYLTAPVVV